MAYLSDRSTPFHFVNVTDKDSYTTVFKYNVYNVSILHICQKYVNANCVYTVSSLTQKYQYVYLYWQTLMTYVKTWNGQIVYLYERNKIV